MTQQCLDSLNTNHYNATWEYVPSLQPPSFQLLSPTFASSIFMLEAKVGAAQQFSDMSYIAYVDTAVSVCCVVANH